MNANTISAFVGGTGRNQMPVLSGDLSTATAATVNLDSGSTAVAVLKLPTQTSIMGASNARFGNAAILGPSHFHYGLPRGAQNPFFSSTSFEGVPFRVRAHGVAGQTLLISLCLGSSATIGSDVVLGTTGAALATVAGGAAFFSIVAELMWSTGSGANGNVAGRHSATISFLPTPTRQVVSDVIITNATAAAVAYTDIAFTVFATAGNAAATTVQFKEFTIELV